MMLGDQLLLAKILLKALEAEDLSEEECERLYAMSTQRPAPRQASDEEAVHEFLMDQSRQHLAAVDAREQREAIDPDIAQDLAANTPEPIRPVQPGEDITENPDDFVTRVAEQRARKSRRMGAG